MKKNVFQSMDEFLFKKIHEMQSGKSYQELLQQINLIPSEQRKVLNKVFSVALVLVPILLIFTMFLKSQSQRSRIELKKDILSLSQLMLSNGRAVDEASQKIYSPYLITSKGDFMNRIQNIVKSLNINPESIVVSDLNIENNKKGLSRSISTISFKNLTLTEIIKLISDLEEKEKMKPGNFNIRKSPDTQLLSGDLEVVLIVKERSGL